MIAGECTYFFMHVMKTGGSTFQRHVSANFERLDTYPSTEKGEERRLAYTSIERLRGLDAERRRSTRFFQGHLPFLAGEIVGADITLTVLRDPVQRTLSMLRHCKRYVPRFADASLEEIYDDGFIFPMYIRNYQSKLLSMTLDDEPKGHTDVIVVDEARLETALTNLERIDILGLQERYDDLLDELRREHGWHIRDVPSQRVSTEDWPFPAHLLERIAADNAADVTLYERAREVYDQRGIARAS
jgi:hypothetical protein